MERRLLTFIVASTAFFFVYMLLLNMFGPPPGKVADKQKAAAKQAGELPADPDPEKPDKAAADSTAQDNNADDDLAAGEEPVAAVQRSAKPTWMTLGSMAEKSGYHMLVTLSSRGGGVERIELTEREEDGKFKFRRVDVRHGYLGYLAGQPATKVDGVKVNVVGPGTPADVAGVKVGDIIVAVKGTVVSSPDDIRRVLLQTKPGQQVSVEVLRGPAAGQLAENQNAADDSRDSDSKDSDSRDSDSKDSDSKDSDSRDSDSKDSDSKDSEGDASDESEPAAPPVSPPAPLVLKAKLTHHPLDLVRLASEGGDDQVAGNLDQLSCLITLGQVNRKQIPVGKSSIPGLDDPATLVWSQPDGTIQSSAADGLQKAEFYVDLSAQELATVGGGAVRLSRSYALAPASYAIDMSVAVENRSPQSQQLAYRLFGPNGLTLEGWWYSNKISPNMFGGAAARDIVYKTEANAHTLISGYDLLEKAKKDPNDPAQNIFAPDGDPDERILKYIGVDAQYFTVAYLPPAGATALTTFRRASADIVADENKIIRHQERAVNSSYFLDSVVADVGPGQSIRQDLRMFAGPKVPETLEAYDLGDCIYYGWFAAFAKILAGLLHILSLVGYFPAIIILTVIVRAGMFPLSRKAAVNAQRMQELAPELKKIADQYKDDMEGRLKAQRELQQRVGFNPLAGCLPMFLQLPIFIGLYRALSVDIELRQEAVSSSTSWASNLAGPDMFLYWGDWLWEYLSGRGTGWLGPYFNILPVIVVGLFLAQQKMFMPPATDEQTALTQKMMSVMTLMMGLFFFRVPAGLCVYFITSSLWGICERILVKKTLPSKPHFDSSVIEGTATPTEKKKETLADRIRQQVAKTETPADRPNKRRRPPGKKKRP